MRKLKVAIIGTNGIPARYGGYETLVDNLTSTLKHDIEFVVFCSKIYNTKERVKEYNGARLIYLPFRANGLQSIVYDIFATIIAWFVSDILLILGPSAGFFLPFNFIFRKKIIVNHGGLDEWKREKYSPLQKRIIVFNRNVTRFFATYHIADNELLKKSLNEKFKIKAVVIEYGGDHVLKRAIAPDYIVKYPFLANSYDLSISRAQIDNNLHLLLDAYIEIPERNLVIISNWNISDYGKKLLIKYKDYSNLFLVNAVYDKVDLDVIRSNTSLYIHSHSRCGTAPSLVEAMSYEIPIVCFDVLVNRLTTNEKSLYFTDSVSLKSIVNGINADQLDIIKRDMFFIAENKYTWKNISKKYLELFYK